MTRVNQLKDKLQLAQDEAIMIQKPSNIFYLSGYHGEGYALITSDDVYVVTDFRYDEQAQAEAPGWQVKLIDNKTNHMQLMANIAADKGVKTLYFEDDAITVKVFGRLEKLFDGCTFKPVDQAVEALREIKDAGELALIAKACAISSQAFEEIITTIRVGQTEKEIARRLEDTMYRLGADGLAFSTIVASGPNGSLPHAVPSDRAIEKGDMITLDFGASYKGYCADMTRTVSVGEASPKMRAIYDLVYRAQAAAQKALAPGKVCSQIDAVARDMIADAGYGDCFGHGLGHAVGIDVHENPRLSALCHDVLRPGHVVTVEPGVYVAGFGGVRIENSCVITQDGAKSLVPVPTALITIDA